MKHDMEHCPRNHDLVMRGCRSRNEGNGQLRRERGDALAAAIEREYDTRSHWPDVARGGDPTARAEIVIPRLVDELNERQLNDGSERLPVVRRETPGGEGRQVIRRPVPFVALPSVRRMARRQQLHQAVA